MDIICPDCHQHYSAIPVGTPPRAWLDQHRLTTCSTTVPMAEMLSSVPEKITTEQGRLALLEKLEGLKKPPVRDVKRIDRFRGADWFLSNPYNHPIFWLGALWPSVEYAFQGSKTLDPAQREQIRVQPNWRQAKVLGRACTLRPGWDEMRDAVMIDLLRIKFSDVTLARHLLATGTAELVEGNWWHDNHFGVCTCANADGRHPRCLLPGENVLGLSLMTVREDLSEQA